MSDSEVTKLSIFKGVTTLIVGAGVSKITNAIVDNNIQGETKLQRFVIFAGKVGISLTVTGIVNRAVENTIDETVKSIAIGIEKAKEEQAKNQSESDDDK